MDSVDLAQRRDHRLPDGRNLAYASWGDGGPVIFHHHGTGSSRFEAAALARAAHNLPLQVIGIDRPGYGASTHDPRRDFRSFQRDIEYLADSLGVERYCVSGISGGAAFACSAARSARAVKVYPLNMPPDLGSRAGRRIPFGLRFGMWLTCRPIVFRRAARRAAANPLARIEQSNMPEIDKRVLRDEIPDIWTVTIKEGTRPGTDGVARDTILLRKKWDVDWDRMIAPIEVRQGKLDPFRPFPVELVKVQRGVSLIEFEGGHIAALGRNVLRAVAEDVLRVA